MYNKNKPKFGMVIFLLPAIILFILYFIYPISSVIHTSLTKWDGMSSPKFIGIKNFITIFEDNTFKVSIKNNILWALAGGFIQVPLAVLVALILAKKPRGWKIFRTIYFFPNVISGIALAMMWNGIYNNEYGMLNGLLKITGLGNLEKNWLGDFKTAFPALVIYGLLYIGYYMVIILAEISSIPEEYYESARIDGASTLQMDWYITLPLIRGAITTCITLAMIYGLRQFEQVLLLTNGGPDNSTSVMVLYLYKELQNFNYGVANASGSVLILLGVIVILSIKKISNVKRYDM